jgi:hypothetical protein
MKTLVQKLISTGADLSTRKALKNSLNYLGIKPENIDKLYIELKNSIHTDIFDRINPRHKLVFLPQCLRNSRTCIAVLGPSGWICKQCKGNRRCKVYRIKHEAESLGYRVFIVPGGSMVFKLISKLKPRAVLGVACISELVMAAEVLKVPMKMVQLSKDGCVDTDVEIEYVLKEL